MPQTWTAPGPLARSPVLDSKVKRQNPAPPPSLGPSRSTVYAYIPNQRAPKKRQASRPREPDQQPTGSHPVIHTILC